MQRACDLDGLRVRQLGQLSRNTAQRVIAKVKPEQLFLQSQLLVTGHRGDVDGQPVVLDLDVGRADHIEQGGLTRLSVATRALRAAHRVVEGGDQTSALAQRIACARLHECLEDAPVDVLNR